MEEKERDIFAEALVLLKTRRLAQLGYVAEELRAVRISDAEEKDSENT